MAARPGPNGRCTVCRHSERARIERMLSAGASKRSVGAKFKLAPDAVWRHWHNHVSAEARAAYVAGAGLSKDQLEQVAADEALSVLDHLKIIRGRLYFGLDAVSEAGDRINLDRLAGRLHENLSLVAKLTGELQRGPLFNIQNNVSISPDYSLAIARIVAAVAPFPDARIAIVAALRDLENGSQLLPPPAAKVTG